MNNEQLNRITHLARFGVEKCQAGQPDHAAVLEDQLMGWWDCALTFGDHDLARAAFRGATAIQAAKSGTPVVVTDGLRRLMWGDNS